MSSTEEIKKERLHDFLVAQLEEIYRYKWFLGEEMHNDPLNEYSMNEICSMWITKNAKTFRTEWISEHGLEYFNGINNTN